MNRIVLAVDARSSLWTASFFSQNTFPIRLRNKSYVQGLEAYSELIARLFEERFPTGGRPA
jgi:hypothetical protein